MCGIAGIVDLRGTREINRDRLVRMTERLAHRGPDGSGHHLAPGVGIGHRRLAIIDLAGSPQPMLSEDATTVLSYNGEIYNFEDLRDDLSARGHGFRTRGDTEVILRGYREFGADVVHRLKGMFAFATWDEREKTLLLARDRLGEKPLYYALTDDGFLVFASELPAVLLGLGRTPPLSKRAVADYFALGYVPEPESIFEGVMKLAPGHRMLAVRGDPAPRIERYWQPQLDRKPIAENEAVEALADRLRSAVTAQMASDVPLGAFLSGGVDSGGVVALMALSQTAPVHTCSVGFDDQRIDETAQARRVAERYGTDHHSERLHLDAVSMIDDAAFAFGEPFADSSALPTMAVSAAARRNVTVALSGDGGDEVFLGYRRYPFYRNEERLKAYLPTPLRRHGLGPLAHAWPKLDWAPRPLRAKATLEALAADAVGGYFRSVATLPDAMADVLFKPSFKAALDGYHSSAVLARHAAEAPSDDPLARAQYIDLMTWLPGRMLTKVDRASMAVSLEVRPPLLHVDLVEWALHLPDALTLGAKGGKQLLKKALSPLLPADLLHAKKRGFAPPLHAWIKDGLDGRVDALATSARLNDTGMFDLERVGRWLAEHRRGVNDHSAGLWALLMFDAFLEQTALLTPVHHRPADLAVAVF